MYLYANVYLWSNEIRPFILLNHFIYSVTHLFPHSSSLSYPVRDITFDIVSSGNMPFWFYAVQALAVTRVRPMPICIIQCLSACIILIHRIFLHFQDLSFNHDLYLHLSLISLISPASQLVVLSHVSLLISGYRCANDF